MYTGILDVVYTVVSDDTYLWEEEEEEQRKFSSPRDDTYIIAIMLLQPRRRMMSMRINSAARAPIPNEMDEMMTSARGSW